MTQSDTQHTFETWMKASFNADELSDIATHGADKGWPHLTYYTDTVELYERFKDEIWNMLLEDTEAIGYKNPYEMIATFGGANSVGSYTQHANLMTWYAAERTAQQLCPE